MSLILVGLDDTDMPGGPGTGRVARGLALRIMELGLGISEGVSRHQLLFDRRIRFTSHNSCKGLAFRSDYPPELYQRPGIEYLESCFQEGSDPGLCICSQEKATDFVREFGRAAQRQVLEVAQAEELAAASGIFLKKCGGSGEGIIGALAAVGLRASGNDGRLVDLRGIKDLKGILSVGAILAASDIERVEEVGGRVLDREALINTLDWVRPSLVAGRPVLRVKAAADFSGRPLWEPVERRQNKAGGEKRDE